MRKAKGRKKKRRKVKSLNRSTTIRRYRTTISSRLRGTHQNSTYLESQRRNSKLVTWYHILLENRLLPGREQLLCAGGTVRLEKFFSHFRKEHRVAKQLRSKACALLSASSQSPFGRRKALSSRSEGSTDLLWNKSKVLSGKEYLETHSLLLEPLDGSSAVVLNNVMYNIAGFKLSHSMTWCGLGGSALPLWKFMDLPIFTSRDTTTWKHSL